MAGLLADLVVVVHLAFIAFVVAGGALVWRWRRLAWLHLPAAGWGAAVELFGWTCPLTPLEDTLRRRAGEVATSGDFVARHLLPLLYPEALTPGIQVGLGIAVIVVNAVAYALIFGRRRA